jgi:hypothetical protein
LENKKKIGKGRIVEEGHIEVRLSGLEIVRGQEKYTRKNEDVRYRKVWRRNEKKKRTEE